MPFRSVDLKSDLNNVGITTQEQHKMGFLSLGSSSLPQEWFPLGDDFLFTDVPFVFHKAESGEDNVEWEGQTLSIKPASIRRLHVLGVASNGDLYDWMELLQGDVVQARVKVRLSDFASFDPAFSENQCAVRFPYLHTRNGRLDNIQPALWYTVIELPEPVTVDRLRLADNPSLHLFALTAELEREESA